MTEEKQVEQQEDQRASVKITDIYNVAQAMEFLQTASQVGVAGMASTEAAVDGLSSVLNAYKLEIGDTSKIADTFFAGIKLGKLSHNQT